MKYYKNGGFTIRRYTDWLLREAMRNSLNNAGRHSLPMPWKSRTNIGKN